jgi:hypothetical protein
MTTDARRPDDLLDWCRPSALCTEFPALENLRQVVVKANETLDTAWPDGVSLSKVANPVAHAAYRAACAAFDDAYDDFANTARILAGLDD